MIVSRHSHGICFCDGTIYVAGINFKNFLVYIIILKEETLMMKMKSVQIVAKNMILMQNDG